MIAEQANQVAKTPPGRKSPAKAGRKSTPRNEQENGKSLVRT